LMTNRSKFRVRKHEAQPQACW